MQWFHGELRAEIAASGTKIKVVQVPNDRRPSIVKHPLNHAGRLVFVARVSLIHRAHAFVGLKLRLEGEIFSAVRLAVARVQSISKYVNVLERAAASVIVPEFVNR